MAHFFGRATAKGFTMVEMLVTIVIIGILAAVVTLGWNGVVTSSANNARSTELKQWASTFDLYKSRFDAWPILPTADGAAGAVTVCLGDFTSTGSKCGNLSSQSYLVNTTMLDAIKKVGKQPQNTAPAANKNVAGPIAYATQTTNSSGIATVTVQYIGFFQGNCPKDLVNVTAGQPAVAIVPTGSSTVACALSNNTFTYNSGAVVPAPPAPTLPSLTPPTVTTNAVTGISSTAVTLNGNLTSLGNSSSVTVSFECGTTTSYGTNTITQSMSTTGGFTAFVTGTPGTTYHCRANALGGNGTTAYGTDQSFTLTLPPPPAAAPPTAMTTAATSVTSTSVTLNGNLTSLGNSSSVTVSFECGTTTSYGTNVSSGSKTATGTFTAPATGTANTTYHCRAKAVGSNNTIAYGGDVSFTMASQSGQLQGNATSKQVTTYEWKCTGNSTQHVLMQYSPPKCSSKTTCSNTSCGPATRVTVTTTQYSCPAGSHLGTKTGTTTKCYYD